MWNYFWIHNMNALVCDQANFSSSLCLSIFWFYGLCYSCDLKLHIWWRATQILHWYREKRTTNHKEEDNFLSFIYQPCFMEVRPFQFRELLSSLPGGDWEWRVGLKSVFIFHFLICAMVTWTSALLCYSTPLSKNNLPITHGPTTKTHTYSYVHVYESVLYVIVL